MTSAKNKCSPANTSSLTATSPEDKTSSAVDLFHSLPLQAAMAAYGLLIALQLWLVLFAWLVCPFGLVSGMLLNFFFLIFWWVTTLDDFDKG
jgi:hypothetical protein